MTATLSPDVHVSGVRVALVEDDPDVRLVVRTALRMSGGFELVGEAADAESAVELLLTTRPDVVILDRLLGRSSGADVLDRVRSAGLTSKVVVYSAQEHATMSQSVDGYVLKGGSIDSLLAAVAAAGRG